MNDSQVDNFSSLLPEGAATEGVSSPSSCPSAVAPALDVAKLYSEYRWQDESNVCNQLECAGGHRWAAVLGTSECPGCKQSTLMLKMRLCPVCNEPASKLHTVVHIVAAGHYGAACRGQKAPEERQAAVVIEL